MNPNQLRRKSHARKQQPAFMLVLLFVIGAVAGVFPPPSYASQDAPSASSKVQSSSQFQITFAELGYRDRELFSPWGSAQYSFRLPENWQIVSGDYLDLDFSYFYTSLEAADIKLPTYFGEVLVRLDDQLLQVYQLDNAVKEQVRLRVDLPADLLNAQPGSNHEISIELDAAFLCNRPHKAKLVIHTESLLSFNYNPLPPVLDLAVYPRPFYQRSFDPDQVRFVLPSHPTEPELRAAASIAANLGKLASGLTISTTTDAEWLHAMASGQAGAEHLFVIGAPDRNEVVTWLNDHTTLPVPIRRREMALSIEGPATVAPGSFFSYTMAVTNTTAGASSSLSLVTLLPRQTNLVNCDPACDGTDQVRWELPSLSPGQTTLVTLTVQLTHTTPISALFYSLENTTILVDRVKGALNTSSLTSALAAAPGNEAHIKSFAQEGYFFLQNEQPVSEGDGILQEIVSPWNPEKAILLISGANEDALHKAAQALSLDVYAPSMTGPTTQVRDIQPPLVVTTTRSANLSLADLGYVDKTIYGPYTQEIAYWFYVPLDWQLTNEALFRLLFAHSRIIEENTSTLSILLNDTPVASVPLNGENATGGVLELGLSGSRIKYGMSNKLSIQVWMQTERVECERIDHRQVWLTISKDSSFYLAHRTEHTALNLRYFSSPFSDQPDLGDLLFVLPSFPGAAEYESLFQLAAALGDRTDGTGFSPAVALGGENLDAKTLSEHHVILIGRPAAHPLFQQVNELLPQPFVPRSNEIEPRVGEVLLRLSPETVAGLIQEMPSPWNKDTALLAITGTSVEGVRWATRALIWDTRQLSGNLVWIRNEGKDIGSIDTRRLTDSGLAAALETAVPELTPGFTATPPPETGAENNATPIPPTPYVSKGERKIPAWVTAVAGAVVIIVAIILVVALRQYRKL